MFSFVCGRVTRQRPHPWACSGHRSGQARDPDSLLSPLFWTWAARSARRVGLKSNARSGDRL